MTSGKKIGMIGHLDHGKHSLAAALVRVLAHGIHVESGKPKCKGCDGHECDDGCAYPGVPAVGEIASTEKK